MMDKSCQSSADSTTTTTSSSSTTTNTNTTQYLKHLNKLSHKISKPIIKKTPFDQTPNQNLNPNPNPNPNTQQSQLPQIQQQQQQQQQAQQQQQQQQQQQHQPPVYNINKNDFRDVVQKLTGSPAHERFSTPPPIHAPKPPSSRLQRIRPPPLAQLSNRPPPLLNNAASAAVVPIPNNNNGVTNSGVHVSHHHHHNNNNYGRPVAPLSPLPPFPTVHATAESPISAYMRYLQNPISGVDSNPKQFSGFSPLAPRFSPRWNAVTPPQPQLQHQFPPPPQPQQHQGMLPPPPPATMASQSQSQSQFLMPTSPLPFGCLNSPRSPYPLLSPSLLFSPSSGQLGFPQLPLSPTVPLPSPRWRAL